MALMLIYRQGELYESLEMATPVGGLANLKMDAKAKLAELLVGEENQALLEEFWVEVAANYSNMYIRGQDLSDFELRILEGIPAKIRAVLYLKVLNVRYILDPKTYQSLLKKTRNASYEDLGLSKQCVSAQSDVVQVFEVCAKESSSLSSHLLNEFKLQFIGGISQHLSGVTGLHTQEHLALLFKLGAIFQNEPWEEYYFKAAHGLEDQVPSVFAHLKKHQVDATCVFKNVCYNLFLNLPTEKLLSLTILDLFVFEGFDYLLRLAISLVNTKSGDILSIEEGEQLHTYLSSQEFLQGVDPETVQRSTQVDFAMIKYENAFKLANSNSCSGNDSELSNLKEANFDLQARLSETRGKIATLEQIHSQVQHDIKDYNKRLVDSTAEKEMLVAKKRDLEEKYSQLTMNENLTNTIKANHEISAANAELSAQLEELKARVEKKREKLKKRRSIVG